MLCTICKRGEVHPAAVETEIKVGSDRLLVTVQAEQCGECGEAYYPAESLRRMDQLKEDFLRKKIVASPIGSVFQTL